MKSQNRIRSFGFFLGMLSCLFFVPKLVQGKEEHQDPRSQEMTKGQVSVEEFFTMNSALLSREKLPETDAEKKASAEFDALCGQKDCAFSHLYWYRDLGEAQAEAKRLKRPILGLHLLGNLTDEYSCANSRFFRAILYSNPDLAEFLKKNFVLYWKSVRSVPQVTVEFGDGRKLRQTITGNSIHYLLNERGDVVDALPGLYEPGRFQAALEEFLSAAPWRGEVSSPEAVASYHEARLLRQGKKNVPAKAKSKETAVEIVDVGTPEAVDASIRSVSKSFQEVGSYRALGLKEKSIEKINALYVGLLPLGAVDIRTQLHPESLKFIRLHTPNLSDKALSLFAQSLREDGMRNDTEHRVTLSRWLAEGKGRESLSAFNSEVYEKVFLTPENDPWMGLNPNTSYSALLQSGIQEGTGEKGKAQ